MRLTILYVTRLSVLFTSVISASFGEYRAMGQERFPFVVPGDDAVPSITDRSSLLHRPAGKMGFVRAKDGHFYVGDERFRMWGMNLCFGANFPTHAEADRLAPHLAKLGVNAVRFHHMDNQKAPNGIWGEIDSQGHRQLDPEMIDRLDYLLAKLHEHGIYADINLHVSRELTPQEGFPVLRDVPWWATSNKYVMYFDADVQAELKRYCRDLLLHTNPYRNLKRVDDPGVAVVEMLNENYFTEQGYSLVDKLPERFRISLRKKWNSWLLAKYQSTQEMGRLWSKSETGLGKPVFSTAQWNRDLGGWNVSRSETELPRKIGVQVPGMPAEYRSLRIAPKETTEHDYQQQIIRQNLSVAKDQPLTLSFWVRSDVKRKFRFEISTLDGGQWRELGLFDDTEATPQWKQIVRKFSPKETISGNAYLAFSFGNDKTAIEFAKIELINGSLAGRIPEGQTIEAGSVAVPDATFPDAAHDDMKSFMAETERSWVRELKNYLVELGVKVPITASQVNYHAPGIVEQETDFADLHNYWHHPMFPTGRDWSATEWTVSNEPMEAGPSYSKWPANSLLMRCGWRVKGMPMTVSEWNYPEPSPFSAGCVPMAAVIAALQDWDGVFFFDYEAFMHVDQSPFFKTAPNNFFSFNAVPAKLTSFALFSNVFLRGDLAPLKDEITSSPDRPLDGRLAMSNRLSVHSTAQPLSVAEIPSDTNLESPGKRVVWNVLEPMKRGYLQIDTEKTIGVWGTIANQRFAHGDIAWDVRDITKDYGILVASSMDELPLEKSKRIVLLAATHTENKGMVWNESKTSVGDQWGGGPAQAVAINGTIQLKVSGSTVRVNALDGRGVPVASVPVTLSNGVLSFEIGGQYKTMWYSIEID